MRRFEKLFPALTLCFAFVAVTAAYLGGFCFYDWANHQDPATLTSPGFSAGPKPLNRMVGLNFLVQERIVEVAILWWVFFFGASIGSFLNVVVWRMPRGRTIVWQGSHCPGCETEIRFRDNIPIAGWWLLSGRCRGCQMDIPIRYPMVELITGLMVVLLFYYGIQTDGLAYPMARWELAGWHFWLLDRFYIGYIAIGLTQTFLLSVLISAWWIRVDGMRLPVRLAVITILFGLIFPQLFLALNTLLLSVYWKSWSTPEQFSFFPEFILPTLNTELRLLLNQFSFGIIGFATGLFLRFLGVRLRGLIFLTNTSSQSTASRQEENESGPNEMEPVGEVADFENARFLGQDVSDTANFWEIPFLYAMVGLFCGGSFLVSFTLFHVLTTVCLSFCFPVSNRYFSRTPWLTLAPSYLTAFILWRFFSSLTAPFFS